MSGLGSLGLLVRGEDSSLKPALSWIQEEGIDELKW